jgi:general secretion pathway protein A
MYEGFYRFSRAPFSNTPDPDFLYPSPQHEQALSILQYALMSRAGFCVITGDIGAGKTTLVRRMLQMLDQKVHVGLVSNTKCETFEELLSWIFVAFELEHRGKDKVEMYEEFVRFLIARYRAGEPVTLIIDEAQNLDFENLEQLRMLSNVNTERGQLLQTILVGQPELWDTLHDPRLEQFAQRVSFDYFLKPLDGPEQVRKYIEYRIHSAGGREGLFDSSTIPLIWEATGGVPRLINRLCDMALVYGYGDGADTIDAELVGRVIADKRGSVTPFGTRSRGSAPVPDEPRDAPAPVAKARMSTIERAARRPRRDT